MAVISIHPSIHFISHAPHVCSFQMLFVHGGRCFGAKGMSRARQAGIARVTASGALWGRGLSSRRVSWSCEQHHPC